MPDKNLEGLTRSALLVLPWSPAQPAGVSVVVRNLARYMHADELQPVVVVNEWGASHARRDSDGTLLFRFSLLGALDWAGLMKGSLTGFARLFRTLRLLVSSRAYAVNFHYPGFDALGVAILKRLRLYSGSLVLSFHGSDARSPQTALEARLWRFMFSVADGVSACSGSLASQIAASFGISRESITVIYNGVDASRFNPAAAGGGGLARLPPYYVVSIGSYLPRKGHRVLLEAFAQLAGEFPDTSLVIAGEDGPERSFLLERATQLGLAGRLACLVGLTPDQVAALLAGARACVQPSHAEPFGLAIIEAGACGVPVAATAVGGHVELLNHGVTGFLFPPGDDVACASALREILGDRDNSRAVAARFRAQVLENFTWTACARAYLELNTRAHSAPGNVTNKVVKGPSPPR